MDEPLVSIIIPTYNRAHLINETLDSVLAQTYTNWECIVVDDGSVDKTAEVLAEYVAKDSRFRYHHRPKSRPKGANACRNYGFELSRGEFINWFDDDDLMLSHKLSEGINRLLLSNLNFVICQSGVYNLDTKTDLGLRSPKLSSADPLNDYIQFKIFWLTGAPLWKRIFLKDNNLNFDEKLQQSQDYDYHVKILAVERQYLVSNRIGVMIRIHENNMSNSVIDRAEKFISNVKARFTILTQYSKHLNDSTIYYLFEVLYQYFIKSTSSQNLKTRLKVYWYLVSALFIFNKSKKSLMLASVKWLLGTFFKNPRFLKRLKVVI